jgi:hypothetical protein
MPASDYYWSRHAIQGFGKMWFLIVPQEADTNGGGASLLGSIVDERDGGLFNSDYPKPEQFDQPQLILKALEERRRELRIGDTEPLVSEVNFPNLNITVQKSDKVKSGVDGFPSLPNFGLGFDIDYSRMQSISIQFGKNTRKLLIPIGFLIRLKEFVKDDDRKILPNGSIGRETIVCQLLVTDQYSVTFESTQAFDANFAAKLQAANVVNAGRAEFKLEHSHNKRVTVTIDNGKDYLIALEAVDWDNLD